MNPYGERNLTDEKILFNYSLSKKRSVTKNRFEILINWLRIFVNRTTLTPDNASLVITASLALHNLLRLK